MFSVEKIKEHAVEDFKDHISNLSQYSEDLSILTWGKPNTSFYYVRYVFDKNKLYITGDLGSAVVCLTEKATIQTLSTYINMISYFIEKIECSTDKYDFDIDVAVGTLKERCADRIEDIEEK